MQTVYDIFSAATGRVPSTGTDEQPAVVHGVRERAARRESRIDQLERLDHNIEDLMTDDELDAALGQGRR